MFRAEGFSNPDDLLGANAGRVGDDLAQVRVVGLFELVFDDDLLIAIGAQNVQLEIADPVLGRHQY